MTADVTRERPAGLTCNREDNLMLQANYDSSIAPRKVAARRAARSERAKLLQAFREMATKRPARWLKRVIDSYGIDRFGDLTTKQMRAVVIDDAIPMLPTDTTSVRKARVPLLARMTDDAFALLAKAVSEELDRRYAANFTDQAT